MNLGDIIICGFAVLCVLYASCCVYYICGACRRQAIDRRITDAQSAILNKRGGTR